MIKMKASVQASLKASPIEEIQTSLKKLKSSGLLASPKSGRQHFWIDLWNEIAEVSSLQITKSSRFVKYTGDHSLAIYQNELKTLNIHQPLFKMISQSWSLDASINGFHLDSTTLLEEVKEEAPGEFFADLNWQIKFRDRMLVLVENGISRVLCILDEIFLPQEEMIADLVSVVYIAKLAGVHVNKIQTGIEQICGFDVVKTTKDSFTGSEFVDFSEVSSFGDALRILRYFDGMPVVVLGGDYCALPQDFEEQLIASEATLIHIIRTPKAQDPFLRRFIDVYQVGNVSEAIRTVYEVTEEACEILFFAGIEKGRRDRQELSQEFLKEVIS